MNNQETQEITAAFEACEEQHVQQITDRLTAPIRPLNRKDKCAWTAFWYPNGLGSPKLGE